MSGKTILIVDDEKDVRDLVSFNLEANGYDPRNASSGEEALQMIQRQPPDLVVLDLMLPGIDGLEVCRSLKGDSRAKSIPVIMLTAKGEEADIVIGLELGADDYVVKPFSPRVLMARIRAALRKHSGDKNAEEIIRRDRLEIDPERREVKIDERKLELTFSEFMLLHLLARRPGKVYTRNQIIDAVRGSNYPVFDRSIDVQVVGLRKKLGDMGMNIETVRGVGYRFIDTDQEDN